jgi:hypothetical protein
VGVIPSGTESVAQHIDAYRTSIEQFAEFLAENGYPTDARSLEREHVEKWLAQSPRP